METLAFIGLIALIAFLVVVRSMFMAVLEEPTHYVLVELWSVHVKTAALFTEQGGLDQPWGKRWRPVRASSIEEARKIGESMRGGYNAKDQSA